jgi:CPA1 family monovalent cation:H+ antiporter
MAIMLANTTAIQLDARNRVQSFAVWSVAVFGLNVLAFLLMGMQVSQIVGSMSAERLREAAGFAGLVVVGVIVTRLVWVLIYNRLAAHFPVFRGGISAASLQTGVVIGWCGMRGLVTMATAFALPHNFPQRDLIVLSAFAVVLATLVLQGLTLAPIIRLLGLHDRSDSDRELDQARRTLATASLAAIVDEHSRVADETRRQFEIDIAALDGGCSEYDERQRLKLAAITAQRERLHELRETNIIGEDHFELLQEELDWRALAIGPEGRSQIEES